MYFEKDTYTIDSSVTAEIEEVQAYYHREYKNWYLSVTYSYKNNDGSSKELEIPAIPLPLPQNHLPVIGTSTYYNLDCPMPYHEEVAHISFAPQVKLGMGVIHDQNGMPIRGDKAYYAIKDTPKSMTKAEIEEALGYKINIIDEEDKND